MTPQSQTDTAAAEARIAKLKAAMTENESRLQYLQQRRPGLLADVRRGVAPERELTALDADIARTQAAIEEAQAAIPPLERELEAARQAEASERARRDEEAREEARAKLLPLIRRYNEQARKAHEALLALLADDLMRLLKFHPPHLPTELAAIDAVTLIDENTFQVTRERQFAYRR
jgi:hypothetical protein